MGGAVQPFHAEYLALTLHTPAGKYFNLVEHFKWILSCIYMYEKLQKEQPAQGSIAFTKETASKQYHKLIQLQNLDQISTSKSRPNFSLWCYKKAWRQRVYIAQAISVFAFFPLFCANFNAPLYPVDSASNPCWIKEILHFISFNVGCNTYEEKNCTFWYIASSIPKSNFETVITETAFILTCRHGPGNLYHRLERL